MILNSNSAKFKDPASGPNTELCRKKLKITIFRFSSMHGLGPLAEIKICKMTVQNHIKRTMKQASSFQNHHWVTISVWLRMAPNWDHFLCYSFTLLFKITSNKITNKQTVSFPNHQLDIPRRNLRNLLRYCLLSYLRFNRQ